jgi:aminodeoxyfutalosine synthase
MISSKTLTFRDPALNPIWEKVRSGERLSKEDGLLLFESHDLIGVGRMANEVARAKSGDSVYFVLNRKLEPTNICVLACKFCDFAVKKGSAEAYEMTMDEMLSKLRPDLHEVHITGGLHPDWPWEWYVDMVRTIKQKFPNIDVKAFTAVEIDFFAKKFKKTHEEVLREHSRVVVPKYSQSVCGSNSLIRKSVQRLGSKCIAQRTNLDFRAM